MGSSSWHLPISRACNNACSFCAVAQELDGRGISAGALRQSIDGAVARGITHIVFTGGEPTLSRQLISAIAYASGQGLHTAMTTNGRQLSDLERVGRFEATGLQAVHISVHGASAATHNALVGGDPVAFEQVQRALELCAPRFELTLRTVLTRSNADELDGLLDRAAALGARFDLRRVQGHPTLDPPDAHAILHRVLEHAHQRGVSVDWHGFERDQHSVRASEPTDADAGLTTLLRAGARTSGMLAGIRATEEWLAQEAAHRRTSVDQLVQELSATGTPVHEHRLPAVPPATGPIHVLALGTADPWIETAVLPGLVHELQQRGQAARLHSVWDVPFSPTSLRPGRLARLRRLANRSSANPYGTPHRGSVDNIVSALPTDGTLIVANAAAWTHVQDVSCPKRVLDHRPLEGFTELGPDDLLRSPMPSMAALYRVAGVPLRQTHWRPCPVHAGHLVPRDPSGPLLIVADPLLHRPQVEAAVRDHGAVVVAPPSSMRELRAFPATLAQAKALFVPARDRPHRAPDLLWLTVAAASGVPIVGSAVAGLVDLVDHEHTGLLYHPSYPDDGAAALTRVADPETAQRLGTAAQERLSLATTASWARELTQGTTARVVWRHGRARSW